MQEVAVDVAAVVQPAALANGPVELVETWTSYPVMAEPFALGAVQARATWLLPDDPVGAEAAMGTE